MIANGSFENTGSSWLSPWYLHTKTGGAAMGRDDDGDVRLKCCEQATEIDVGVRGDIGRGPRAHQRSIAVADLNRITTQLRKL